MTADLLRLADVVLKVSVLMGAAALTTRALARRSAAARHLVWTFAIGASLAMPILTSVVPPWTMEVLPPTAGISEPARPEGRANTVDKTITRHRRL